MTIASSSLPLLLLLLLAVIIDNVAAVDPPANGGERSRTRTNFLTLAAILMAGFPVEFGDGAEDDDGNGDDPRLGTKARVRQRKFVTSIFNEHGPKQ